MLNQFKPDHPNLQRPGFHLRWKFGILKFLWWRCLNFFLLKTSNTQFGKKISLQGKLRISGPGLVIIEDNVIISDNVDLYTFSKSAIIKIGKNSYINGTRISSVLNVSIGEENILADVRILDTDFHWAHKNRMRDFSPPPAIPVKTDKNVWVSAGSALMKGVSIGENSVIAFGSVVTGIVPANEVWGGVPAKKISDVPLPGNY